MKVAQTQTDRIAILQEKMRKAGVWFPRDIVKQIMEAADRDKRAQQRYARDFDGPSRPNEKGL